MGPFIPPDEFEVMLERRETLADLLDGVPTQPHEEAELWPGAEEVLRALLLREDSAAPLLADEWAFLHSNSWMVAKLRHPIDAFRDAGAVILDFAADVARTLMQGVIPAEKISASSHPGNDR